MPPSPASPLPPPADRAAAYHVLRVDLRPGRQQRLHHLRVPILGCQVKRSPLILRARARGAAA
eukprot:4061284-Prymnesium_polylepis.1